MRMLIFFIQLIRGMRAGVDQVDLGCDSFCVLKTTTKWMKTHQLVDDINRGVGACRGRVPWCNIRQP